MKSDLVILVMKSLNLEVLNFFHKTAEKQASQIQGLVILKPVKISWPNLNHNVFISFESSIEMLVGVAPLPSLFLPCNMGILLHKTGHPGQKFLSRVIWISEIYLNSE